MDASADAVFPDVEINAFSKAPGMDRGRYGALRE